MSAIDKKCLMQIHAVLQTLQTALHPPLQQVTSCSGCAIQYTPHSTGCVAMASKPSCINLGHERQKQKLQYGLCLFSCSHVAINVCHVSCGYFSKDAPFRSLSLV